ncbi:MAG: EVE domain-containing protein [Saccharospirillaceae bacterium]|nr:EVE domain-containing protein [Pseudomonadales bacterium]NRB78035.1 EVE domain-containing protein [Saccharospirillaceae bacterium]
MKQFWLMKSEPEAFSLEDLKAQGAKGEHWDGVRNYQARNHMQNMQQGDLVIYYHSSCKPAGAVGVAKVIKEAYPDFTAFDHTERYYDAKSDPENPRWFMVDINYTKTLKNMVTLKDIKANPLLSDMQLVTHARLSVSQMNEDHFNEILAMSTL